MSITGTVTCVQIKRRFEIIANRQLQYGQLRRMAGNSGISINYQRVSPRFRSGSEIVHVGQLKIASKRPNLWNRRITPPAAQVEVVRNEEYYVRRIYFRTRDLDMNFNQSRMKFTYAALRWYEGAVTIILEGLMYFQHNANIPRVKDFFKDSYLEELRYLKRSEDPDEFRDDICNPHNEDNVRVPLEIGTWFDARLAESIHGVVDVD